MKIELMTRGIGPWSMLAQHYATVAPHHHHHQHILTLTFIDWNPIASTVNCFVLDLSLSLSLSLSPPTHSLKENSILAPNMQPMTYETDTQKSSKQLQERDSLRTHTHTHTRTHIIIIIIINDYNNNKTRELHMYGVNDTHVTTQVHMYILYEA